MCHTRHDLSFSSDFFTYQLDFSLFWPLKSSAIHWLTCFRVSTVSCAFSAAMNAGYRAEAVSCATCLADNNFRNVSKKWVRSWSHTKNYNGNSKAFCVKRNTIKRKKNSRNNNSDRKIIMTQNVFSLIPQTWESVYYALIETS